MGATAVLPPPAAAGAASRAARDRLDRTAGGPAFLSDWLRALFLHFEVPPAALQPFVPFPLDLREGSAWVSLVAFEMVGLRPSRGGRAAAWAARPVATHPFLNVRTYVTHGGEPGIFFLAEWLPNRLSTLLGPVLFGLPYLPGRLDYRHGDPGRALEGSVEAPATPGRIAWRGRVAPGAAFAPAPPGSAAEFLCERYTAFTFRWGWSRLFRIAHAPWPLAEVEVERFEGGLVAASGSWWRRARPAGAHFSPGVEAVRIGPCRVAHLHPHPAAPREFLPT